MDIDELTKKTEKISQTYAKLFNIKRDDSWFILKLQEEMGELVKSYLEVSGQTRISENPEKQELKQNFEEEVIDVLCHTLVLAHHNKIDIKKVITKKWLKWEV